MKSSALFPESLRVGAPGEHLYTTSYKVAEHFDLPHEDVQCSLRTLLADMASLEAKSDKAAWIWSPPSRYPEYHMSEKGFALLVMQLDCPAAEQWKHRYLTTFLQMQSCLKGDTP